MDIRSFVEVYLYDLLHVPSNLCHSNISLASTLHEHHLDHALNACPCEPVGIQTSVLTPLLFLSGHWREYMFIFASHFDLAILWLR